MAEDDAQARSILDQIYRIYQRDALPVFLMLHSMNIRGTQLVLAYELCQNDLTRLTKAVRNCNGYFIQDLNQLTLQRGLTELARHTSNIYEE